MTAAKWLMAGLTVICAHRASAQICMANANPLLFGTYDSTSPRPTDSMSSVTVTCSGRPSAVVSYQINLVGGAIRQMNGTAGAAYYRLYSDASRTRLWGDCNAGQSCVSDSYVLGNTTGRRTYPVFSRLLPRQAVAPGPLADTVVVLLRY
jgi:spore coat protein U-like protein